MKKNSYSYDDLITCGNGELFGPGNAKLPLPPMLMFDRITEINDNNGAFNKGSLKAELDIKNDLWFFDCHFKDDPVMPGCLGLDAMWQLVGFYGAVIESKNGKPFAKSAIFYRTFRPLMRGEVLI